MQGINYITTRTSTKTIPRPTRWNVPSLKKLVSSVYLVIIATRVASSRQTFQSSLNPGVDYSSEVFPIGTISTSEIIHKYEKDRGNGSFPIYKVHIRNIMIFYSSSYEANCNSDKSIDFGYGECCPPDRYVLHDSFIKSFDEQTLLIE